MVKRCVTSSVASIIVCLAAASCGGDKTENVAASTSSAMSKTIHSDYGLTVFGGQGDCQPMACGQQSCSSQPWYAASSQRYGCGVHLKVEANGKCVVVETADAGPASWVESKAHTPILDASPAVAEYIFGVSSIGWSDLRANPGVYTVHVTETSLALGPCDGGGSNGGGGGGTNGGGGGGGTSGGGAACGSDGDCNPGNDGSGKICVNGTCVAGCNTSAQCPGVTTCVGGQCQ